MMNTIFTDTENCSHFPNNSKNSKISTGHRTYFSNYTKQVLSKIKKLDIVIMRYAKLPDLFSSICHCSFTINK